MSSSAAPSSPHQGKNNNSAAKDASIELRDFVYDVESSAKKILQRSNKKRLDEAIAKKQRERREMYGGTPPSSSKGRYKHVSPDKKQQQSATAAAASSASPGSFQQTVVLQIPAGMKGALEATSKYGFTPSPVKTTMKIDRPSLSVTVSSTATETLASASPIKGKHLSFASAETATFMPQVQANVTPVKTTLSKSLTSPSSLSMPQPPEQNGMSLPPPERVGTPTTPIGGRNAGKNLAMPSPVRTIHSKLHKSPLFTRKMGSTDSKKVQAYRAKKHKQALSSTLGTEVEEEVEDFRISRGIGSILASKGKNKKKGKHQDKLAQVLAQKKSGHASPHKRELQGPISWSLDDLRVKHRCEQRRADSYEAYLRALEEAKVLEREDGVIMAVAEQEPHPIYQLYKDILDQEVTQASNRARARNRMRRFVLDVHTVWVTNLSHLEEHRDLDYQDQDESDAAGEGGTNNKGIAGRRDSDAIYSVSSQIQSIAPTRTFKDAQEHVEKQKDEGEARRAAFLKSASSDLAVSLKTPPALHKPIADPPEFWTLVNGESVLVPDVDKDGENLVMQQSKVFVNRIRRRAKHGEVPQAPLWSATVFNVVTSEENTIVLEEGQVNALVEADQAKEEKERKGKKKEPLSTATIVHKQGIRLQCGDVMVGALASVYIEKQGRRIRVSIKLHFRGRAAFAEANRQTFLPPPSLTLETTTFEVVARLKKQHTVSALDLNFWLAPTNGDSIWRQIIPLLVYSKWTPNLEETDCLTTTADEASQGEEKKADEAAPPKRSKKGRKKGDKNKEGKAENLKASRHAHLLKLTIPQDVTFAATPHHDECDSTVRIGGLTTEDVNEEFPLPLLPGTDDFYSAVATGYELINCLQIVDGELMTTAPLPQPALDSAVPADLKAEKSEAWADETFNCQPPLSLRVSGRIGFHQFCPGVVAVGRKGLWWATNRREGHHIENEDRRVAPEITRPVASYLRDSNLSSSMSVLVNCILALESPLLAPLQMCWEPQEATPPPAMHLEVDCIMPLFMNTPNVLISHPLDSPLDSRTAPTVLVLTRGEVPTDFKEKAPHGTKEKHRRRANMFLKTAFRTKVLASLLSPNEVIPPYVFGVTQKGAQCNTTGVNGRNMWHSEQRCVEQLCRVRGPIDYLYVSKNEFSDVTGGIHNEPNVYTMHMYGYKMNELSKNGEKSFNEQYDNVLNRREAKMKQEALAAKIEAGKLLMDQKRAEQELIVRKEGLAKYENMAKGGGKVGEGLSTRAWLKRVKRSVVISFQHVGTQGWEQRLDPKYNQTFYHNTDPYITPQLGNQWDPPEDWNEDLDEMLGGSAADGIDSRRNSRVDATMEMGRAASRGRSGGYVRLGTRGSDSNNLKSLLDDDVESTGSEVERMVDALAGNDEFIKMIAHKLGVPESQIRGIDRQIPLNPREDETSRSEGFREEEGNKKPGMVTMAGETELADDDDGWSDSDDEVGGAERPGDDSFPQDHVDVRKNFVRDRAAEEAFNTRFHGNKGEWKSVEEGAKKKLEIPKLGIEGKINIAAPLESLEAHVGVRGYGWRRLGKEKVSKSFFAMKEHKIDKCTGEMFNKPSKASMVGMVDPKDAVDHDVNEDQFEKTTFESMFIRNVLDDIDRCVKMTEVRVQREKMLMDESVNSLQEIINVQPSEFTTVDQLVAKDNEEKSDEMIAADNAHKAILAVKNANFDDLETVLDDGVQIDTKDEYGNTLLILACQQGNKRMAKFLLRRGALINSQNNLGNTVLHYLHEYKNTALFEYMKAKGADDSLINADGTTCYEGLKKDKVDEI